MALLLLRMNNGWIRLHRQIQDNELWLSEPFTKAQAWIDLILNANHKENTFFIRGNAVHVERGQLGWSEVLMAHRWQWSREKVRRFLNHLETRQQIRQQKDRYITTIMTILNYEKYQNETADETAEKQQKNSRRDINKNVKNDKNEKNDIGEQKIFIPPTLDEVKAYFSLNGFLESVGERAFRGYEAANWHDSHGNKIKNWKQKMNNVWFEEKNKAPKVFLPEDYKKMKDCSQIKTEEQKKLLWKYNPELFIATYKEEYLKY